MNKKSMTIDELARMVQRGFEESKVSTQEQFKEVGERLNQVDEHFSKVHRELSAIRRELLGVIYRPEFDDLEERVKDLENMLAMPSKKAA